MTETGQDFTIYQGEGKTITIPIVDGSGDPVNMTGFTAAWTVTDGNAAAALTKTTADGIAFANGDDTNDYLVITLDPEDTEGLAPGFYAFQVAVRNTDGEPVTTTTGALKVELGTAIAATPDIA